MTFYSLSWGHIFKDSIVSLPPNYPKKTNRGCQPNFHVTLIEQGSTLETQKIVNSKAHKSWTFEESSSKCSMFSSSFPQSGHLLARCVYPFSSIDPFVSTFAHQASQAKKLNFVGIHDLQSPHHGLHWLPSARHKLPFIIVHRNF